MEPKRNHDAVLVTLADRNFIDQAKQLFSSVYWNAGWKGDYMLLSHEIPEKELKWFRDKGILVKKCKPLYKNKTKVFIYHQLKEYPSTIFDVFYLFTSEFKKWKNVVFLEADTMVRASLDHLDKVQGFWATDFFDNRLGNQFNYVPREIIKKYDLGAPAFNPGLIAFSTDIIKGDTFKKAKIFSDKYRNITDGNEGIFNLLLYKKWNRLPSPYNIWPDRTSIRCHLNIGKVKGIVLHFVGVQGREEVKPWNRKNQFYSEWKYNLNKAELIDLSNIPPGRKWRDLTIISNSMLIYIKYTIYWKIYERLKILAKRLKESVKNLGRFISWKIYSQTKEFIHYKIKNFTNYKIIARLKIISARILGIIGQSIKKISPSLYHKLKGKNGTKPKKKS